MKFLILLVIGATAMKREDCTHKNYVSVSAYYSGVLEWPMNVHQMVDAIRNADDWEVCEPDLLPRICLLDRMYGQAVNRFHDSKSFNIELQKIGYIAKLLEEKCNTRTNESGRDNNL